MQANNGWLGGFGWGAQRGTTGIGIRGTSNIDLRSAHTSPILKATENAFQKKPNVPGGTTDSKVQVILNDELCKFNLLIYISLNLKG